MPVLTTCLIANRGEIAVRVLRACRELGIRSVAVYSDADATAKHVLMADEAYRLGAAPASDSYLNADTLIEVALASGCDCLHPGYGFLSESAAFAQRVTDAGITWIGPGADAIRRMGLKTEARTLMERAGVPLAPGFQSDDAESAAFVAAAEQIGYPIMVKAAGGGGGKGIRIVYNADDLPAALDAARREAASAFGDSRVFIERYLEHARHIEIQVMADTHGNTVHLFERECSAQRRHQKVIEESPSPLLDAAQRARMGQTAVEAARAVGYINAGTVEFIAAPDGTFYFLEMNTRLQVEHPVTELVTGVDLVKCQFAIASGEPLPFTQDSLTQRGHAIECRVYAEDARNGFVPAVGTIARFIPPEGPGIRVDSGVQSGDTIGIHYDPMIAKIIVHAHTRNEVITRMDSALAQTVVLGTTTNMTFLRALLNHPAFRAGTVDTTFIETHLDELLPPDAPLPDAVLIAAALHDLHNTGHMSTLGTAEPAPDPWARMDSFRVGGDTRRQP